MESILTDTSAREKALGLVEQGTELVNRQRLHEAKRLFAESVATCPTAEGFTFLGWMLFQEGMVQEAIDLCKQAIEIDPEFGNPYNDIGSYLMQVGRLDAAIPWLEKAKNAKRYQPKHFPYLNLGRLYLRKGWLDKALAEYEGLLAIDPSNEEARDLAEKLRELPEQRIPRKRSKTVTVH